LFFPKITANKNTKYEPQIKVSLEAEDFGKKNFGIPNHAFLLREKLA